MSVTIDVSTDLINWLVRVRWLAPREAYASREIAAAITAMLEASAKASLK